jgi:hypothetical protein
LEAATGGSSGNIFFAAHAATESVVEYYYYYVQLDGWRWRRTLCFLAEIEHVDSGDWRSKSNHLGAAMQNAQFTATHISSQKELSGSECIDFAATAAAAKQQQQSEEPLECNSGARAATFECLCVSGRNPIDSVSQTTTTTPRQIGQRHPRTAADGNPFIQRMMQQAQQSKY